MQPLVKTEELSDLARILGRLVMAQSSQAVKGVQMELLAVGKLPSYFPMLIQLLHVKELPHNIRRLAVVMMGNFIKDRLPQQDEELGKYCSQLINSLKDISLDLGLKKDISAALAKLISKEGRGMNFRSLLTVLNSSLAATNIDIDFCICVGRSIIQSQLLNVSEAAPILDKFIQRTLQAKENLRISLQRCEIVAIFSISDRIKELVDLITICFGSFEKDELSNGSRISLLVQIIPIAQQPRTILSHSPHQNHALHQKMSLLKSQAYNLMAIVLERCSCIFVGHVGDFNRKISHTTEQIMNSLSGMFIYENQYATTPSMEQLLWSQLNLLCKLYSSPVLSQLLKQCDLTLLQVISSILEFTHHQIQDFAKEPTAFSQMISTIIQASRRAADEKDIEESPWPQQLSSIKCKVAELFVSIAVARPNICSNVLDQLTTTVTSQVKEGRQCLKSLLMMNILCKFTTAKQRGMIGSVLQDVLSNPPPNIFHRNQNNCIQYALYLVSLSNFLREINSHHPSELKVILMLTIQLISNKCYFEVYQILASQLAESLFDQSWTHKWMIKEAFTALNSQLVKSISSRKVTQYLLDTIFYFAQNTPFSHDHCRLLEETLRNTGKCIEIQLNFPNFQQIIVNKSWNIIRVIMQHEIALRKLRECIEQVLTPLIDHFMVHLKGDFEEDLFLLMTALISHAKTVGKFVMEIYRLVPLVFYGEYEGRFGHAFEAMQLLIYYGRQNLKIKKEILKEMLGMCLFSVRLENDRDSCQGVLLLHSLVINLAEAIGEEGYIAIQRVISQKFTRKHLWKILKVGLISLQGLCLAFSPWNWVKPQEISSCINRMLGKDFKEADAYFSKAILVSACQIILKLPAKKMQFYLNDCCEILKIQSWLIRLKETNELQRITSLRDNIINKITALELKKYLTGFIGNLRKIHADLFDILMQANEWRRYDDLLMSE